MHGMRGEFSCDPPDFKRFQAPYSPISPAKTAVMCRYKHTAPGRFEYDGDEEVKRRRQAPAVWKRRRALQHAPEAA